MKGCLGPRNHPGGQTCAIKRRVVGTFEYCIKVIHNLVAVHRVVAVVRPRYTRYYAFQYQTVRCGQGNTHVVCYCAKPNCTWSPSVQYSLRVHYIQDSISSLFASLYLVLRTALDIHAVRKALYTTVPPVVRSS